MSKQRKTEQDWDDLARTMYEAYANNAGFKSMITGTDLPTWTNLSSKGRDAWIESAKAAYKFILG